MCPGPRSNYGRRSKWGESGRFQFAASILVTDVELETAGGSVKRPDRIATSSAEYVIIIDI